MFADTYEENRDKLVKDSIIALDGVVSLDEYSGSLKMRVSNVHSLDSARMNYAKYLSLTIHQKQFERSFVDSLKALLVQHKFKPAFVLPSGQDDDADDAPEQTGCKVALNYLREDLTATVRFGEDWQVEPNDALLQELSYLIGQQSVELVY